MKVCFFHVMSLRDGGGCENNFIRTAAALAERGIDVEIVSCSNRFHAFISFLLGVFYLNWFKIRGNKYFRFSDKEIAKRLGKARWVKVSFSELSLKLNESDVIYTKNEILDLLVLRFLPLKKQLICGMHTNVKYAVAKTGHERLHNFLYASVFYKFLLNKCNFFRTLNADDQELLIKSYQKSAKNIFLVGNPVNVEHFSPKFSKNKIFRVIFVGRFCPQKGVMDLLNLINQLNAEGFSDKIEYVLIGSGTLREDFDKNLIQGGNVSMLDKVEYEEMPAQYQKAAICVVPSKWETFNSVVLEAQSCSLPVVAFNIPGPKAMVIDGETGYLVRSGDLGAFKKRILELYKLWQSLDNSEFMLMGSLARENVLKNFSEKSIFTKLRKMFELTAV